VLLVGVLFAPPLLMKNRITVATFVPNGRILMESTPPPLAPAVKIVTTVPDPSFAVLAALTVPHEETGAKKKIGDVFAAIY
jgi:hypothetical protein